MAWVGHRLIRLGFVGCFGFRLGKHTDFPHDPEQAFGASGIASFTQSVLEFHHTKVGITAVHIFYQLEFCFSAVNALVQERPDITIREIKETLKLNVCSETIGKMVVRLGYRVKKKSIRASEQERPRCKGKTEDLERTRSGSAH